MQGVTRPKRHDDRIPYVGFAHPEPSWQGLIRVFIALDLHAKPLEVGTV